MTDKPINPAPPEPMPMDRIGVLLGDMAALGKNMADRNLELWSKVSQNLSNLDDNPYTADTLANDAARALDAAMANVQDTWDFMLRTPERERVADTVPTVFILVEASYENGRPTYIGVDPVWIRIPGPRADEKLGPAVVALTGDKPAGVRALRDAIGITPGDARHAYLLAVASINKPVPGTYTGVVYVKTPSVRPIANLRIVIEDPS